MIIHIEEFTPEAFDKFIEKINKLEKGEIAKIYIDTSGGDLTIKDCYLDIIDSLESVELIGVICMSAGFELLYQANCKKRILPSAYGCIHVPAWNTEIGVKGVPRGDYAKFKIKSMQEDKLNYEDILTKEEYKIYKNGDNLYINSKRMKEICNIK